MSEISEPTDRAASEAAKPGNKMLKRILVIMSVLLVISIVISPFVFGWRETGGLVIGGALSFLNFYWLKASLGRMLGLAASGNAEPTALWLIRYNLRFVFLLIMILGIALTGIVSLPALFAGLLSLAAAIVVEGFIQLFLAVFIRREGI